MTDVALKSRIWEEVLAATTARADAARALVEALQESLKAEAKSTAGDKHETGRAMVQQEMERAIAALELALATSQALRARKPGIGPPARWGSWVELDGMHVLIAEPLGRIETSLGPVHVISLDAPLARALIQRAAAPGDAIDVNGRTLRVKNVR